MPENEPRPATAAESLAAWREAERVASVVRRGRAAAELAATTPGEAEQAARATAEAARTALEASRMADEAATKTAESARRVVEAARRDVTTTTVEVELADSDVAAARGHYQDVVAEAERRGTPAS